MELDASYKNYISSMKEDVRKAQIKATVSVNKELILLYWRIGKQILEMQEKEKWGSKVVEKISKDLKETFPDMKGFSPRNLTYMQTFVKSYPDYEFTQQLAAQIPWFHNCLILDKLSQRDIREWYIKKTIENGWSRNVLMLQIDSQLYERQGQSEKKISNFKKSLPSPLSDLAQDMMKDPYNFEFLGLSQEVSEKEIEKSLENKVSKLLLEMGTGFAYMGRQYPLKVGTKEFYLDMLFYNVQLRSYVVVELKGRDFKPADAGQLNFYLTAVDREIKHPDDNPTIGLVICRSKDGVVAEYSLDGMNKPIGVSEFKLKGILPDAEEFEEKLKLETDT